MKIFLLMGFLLVGTGAAFAAGQSENKSSTCCKTCAVDQGGCRPDQGNVADQPQTGDVAANPGDKSGDSGEGK
jgi:hypothetical protein